MPGPYTVPDEFYAAIGKCLHAWSSVEMALAELFVSLHDAELDQTKRHLRAAFDAIQSLDVRLSMINASVQSDPRNEAIFKEKWGALYNKTSRMARKRHQVAHFSISAYHTRGNSEPPVFKLEPFSTLTSAMANSGRTPLTYEHLYAREQSFRKLSGQIMRHCRYLWLVRGRSTLDRELIADPAHLLGIGDAPNPTDSEPPPRSSQA